MLAFKKRRKKKHDSEKDEHITDFLEGLHLTRHPAMTLLANQLNCFSLMWSNWTDFYKQPRKKVTKKSCVSCHEKVLTIVT